LRYGTKEAPLTRKNIFFFNYLLPDMPEKIALLGSTGSIGTQTLDVISRYPGKFQVEILTAASNTDLLTRQARQFMPSSVVINDKTKYRRLKENLSGTAIKIYAGEESLEQVVSESDAETVLTAIVGYSGLRPTIAAIKAGKKIALANKETLVVAGEIISKMLSVSASRILPVDSEHSAIFQCLTGEEKKTIEKITLTASGGPFLNLPADKLENVTKGEALNHPNWTMGDKITIDSASMMNKGLEVIEAKWLFDLEPDQIEVLIHPQSIIHSFVHFSDGSVKAQLGLPDMRLPILYALTFPDRYTSELPRLDFKNYPSFTFFQPDMKKFPNLQLAYNALRKGGNMPCILNAANERAVSAFLKRQIAFTQMPDVIEYTMGNIIYIAGPDLSALEETDRLAREIADNYITKLQKRK
jgi:1-deoxy-D-xylulose-5-phosphate reductoisomerase